MQKWKLEGKKRVRLFRSLALAGVILTVDLLFSSCTGTGKDSVTLTENGSAVLTDAQAQVTAAAAEETTEAAKEEESTRAQTQNSSEKICVDVCGAVQSEGIVYLPEGARVYEAIEAAGGFSEDADTRAVNQAMILSDGVQLRIPTREETQSSDSTVFGIVSGTPAAENSGSEEGSLVNINTADAAALETLPGIGEAKAAAIIEYREKNGSFQQIEDVKNVPGIKDAGYEKIRDRITCG